MDCEQLGLFMAKFYDNLLTEEEKKELGVHLGVCNVCRKKSKDMLPALICIERYMKCGLDEGEDDLISGKSDRASKSDLQKLVYELVGNMN